MQALRSQFQRAAKPILLGTAATGIATTTYQYTNQHQQYQFFTPPKQFQTQPPHFLNHFQRLASTDDNQQPQQLQQSQQSQQSKRSSFEFSPHHQNSFQQQQESTPSSYSPQTVNVHVPEPEQIIKAREMELAESKAKREKDMSDAKLQHKQDVLQQFEEQQQQQQSASTEEISKPTPSPSQPKVTTKKSSWFGDAIPKHIIEDGLEHIEVPVRVFPDFVPITLDEANELGPIGYLRYPVEHTLDFFRNRIDDITYLITGEIRSELANMERYHDNYQYKDSRMIFNPYYEAIYRGWFDSHGIRLKLGGSLPRFDYKPWLLFRPRPQVYFDMIVPNPQKPTEIPPPRRIVIQLYYDVLPNSTQNFIGLCDGFIDADRYISYNHNYIHRIDHGHAFFAGDVITRDGTSGIPFYANHESKYLANEKFFLPHDGPGCVVMDNGGIPDHNSSQFFISQRAMPELEQRYVVIGHVVEGIDVVQKIDQIPTNELGVPLYPIKILKSGILITDSEKDDAFLQFKKGIKEFKDRLHEPVTPPPIENNPIITYP